MCKRSIQFAYDPDEKMWYLYKDFQLIDSNKDVCVLCKKNMVCDYSAEQGKCSVLS